MRSARGSLYQALEQRGLTRRSFLKFCAAVTATLALPPHYAHRIAEALTTAERLPLIWLEGQDCAGNSEALLRASRPTVTELLLDSISLDHHHLLMAPSGRNVEKSIHDTISAFPGRYLVVIEGSIPLADGGVYCTIGGRAFAEIVRETCANALATIAVGACAWDGGLPAASGGATGAVGAGAFLQDVRLINIPGCPANVENIVGTIVHYLTFGDFPALDGQGRPLFAFGDLIHDHCERLPHFRARRFVRAWGDAGAQQGWCLYQMGCKGPYTNANCPTVKFNSSTSWPVDAGHGCVGCMAFRFWDAMNFYEQGGPAQLPDPAPVAYQTPVPQPTVTPSPEPTQAPTPPPTSAQEEDEGGGPGAEVFIGAGAAGVAGVATAYGVAKVIQRRRRLATSDGARDEEGTEEKS
jgi:hydrogenase small subunit